MILIVEKEPSIARMFDNSFISTKIKFVTVTNGKDALQYLIDNNKKVKVVITEIKHETLNGIDLIKGFNNKFPDNIIQFIVVSQYKDYNTIRLAFKQQIFDFLERPINPDELMDTTTQAIKKYAYLDHNKLIKLSNIEDLVDSNRIATIYTLLKSIQFRDAYTEKHCERVAKTVSIIADELNLDEQEKSKIKLAALLHDIGIIGVPDSILLKEDKLTNIEFEIMKKHSDIGYEIVKGCMDEDITKMILHHHEHVDGTGYPKKLKGEDIPLGSRMIYICDVYDALRSTRPYRKALSSIEAIEEMNKDVDEFDYHLYTTFIKNLNKINTIYNAL